MVEADVVHLVLTTNDQLRSIDVSLWSFETLGNGVTVARLTLEQIGREKTLENPGFLHFYEAQLPLFDPASGCKRL